MVAIVSGASLGLTNSSLNVLGSQGALGQANLGRAGEGVYVNAATGNLVVQNRDEVVIGRGLDLSLVRTYNSQGFLNDDNGDNWRLGVYRKVYNLTGTVNTAGSTVTRVAEDGSESIYTYDASLGKYVSNDGAEAYDTLAFDGVTQTWTWTDGDSQVTERYDAANGGRITLAQDADGNGLTFIYNAAGLITQVSDASGETTFLDYSGKNLTDLRTVTSAGQTLIRTRYAYDTSNRLIQVITDLSPEDASIADGKTYVVSYAYDGTSKRVASITQSDGTSVAFTYELVADGTGTNYRVKTVTDALNRTTTLTYTLGSAETVTATANANAMQVMSVPLNNAQLTAAGWAAATTPLDNLTQAASVPQIGFDSQGRAIAVWLQINPQTSTTHVFYSRYSANVWSAPVQLDNRTNPVTVPQLFVDAASGNAIATWVQSDGSANSTYVARFVNGAWAAPELVENLSPTTNPSTATSASINGAGKAVVAFVQNNKLFANVYDGTSWGTLTSAPQISLTANTNTVTAPSTSIDANGNAIVTWQQNNVKLATVYANVFEPATGWAGATALTSGTAASAPQVRFDGSGKAWLIYVQNNDLLATQWSGTAWGTAATVDGSANPVIAASPSLPQLYVDPSGNAAVTWLQKNGAGIILVWVNRFTGGAWGGAQLASTSTTAQSAATVAINGAGTTVVAYVQSSKIFASRYTPGAGWSAGAAVPNADTAAIATTVLPIPSIGIGIDAQGNAAAVWAQDSTASIYASYYDAGAYYKVPAAGASWNSIAQTLYGNSAIGPSLQTALGSPTLSTGLHLGNLPATLNGPPVYVVQANDTWQSIAWRLYGDTQAGDDLAAALGNPALTAGAWLSVPSTFSYQRPSSGQMDVADPIGLNTSVFYDDKGQLTKVLTPAVGGVRSQTQFAYDASGNVTQVTDSLGNVFAYGYDASGNRTLDRDAAGNTVTRTYGSKNELLTETAFAVPDPDGAGAGQPASPLTTRYVYNANHLRFVVSAEGRVTEYRYNGFGQQIAAIQYSGNLYALTGLNPGDALSVAQLGTWVDTADKTGSLRSDSIYDFRGQVASTTTYTDVDAAGNGVVNGFESVKQYVYDQAGNLLKTVDPRGVATPAGFTTTYLYDGLGRLLSTTDATGRTTLTQYDDANGKTVLTLANGLVTTSTCDAAGHLISVLQSANSLALGTTNYFYDADGRLRRTEDPTGIKTHVLYDEAGRKIGEIDGNGGLTEYRYDANNDLTRTIRYANPVSAANLASLIDAQGKPTNIALATIRPAASTQDRSTWNAYDSANRLVKSVDELGFVTQRFYDGASRLTDVVRFDPPISTAALGDAPAAASINTAFGSNDRLTRNFYDGQGKLRGTLDAEGNLVEYKYDAAGQLIETVSYSKATDAPLRASGTLAQLIPAENANEIQNDIHSYTLHNAKGQVVGQVDGESYLTENVYDAVGNKTQVIRYATKVTYTAGATVASLRPVASAQDQVTISTYTALNQLASETNPEGTLTQYTYDEVGNLTKTVKAVNTSDVRTLTAQYDKQGRLTAELSGNASALLTGNQTQAQIDAIWAANAIHYTYDVAGRRISTTDANGNKTLFYYDADGRRTHAINALGEVQENRYNTLGQLTQTIAYGTRLSSTTLATLSGGLVNATLTSAITGVANAALDSTTSYSYTVRGQVASTTDPRSFATSQTYNAFGEAISRSQQVDLGQTLEHTYAYDKRGLLTQTVWDPTGINTSTTTAYDAFGRATQSTDANGNVRTRSYDKLGRVITTVDPTNAIRVITYDAFARVLTQRDALNNTTLFAYSDANRSVTVTTPEGIVTTTARNRLGETQTITDGRGNTTTYTYDRNGNLVRVDNPAGFSTSLYDKADRLIETTDANGVKTDYTYDAANRVLTRTVDPGVGRLNLVTTYAYDAKGQTVSVTDARGVVTQTQFDLKGEVTRVIVDPTELNPTGLNLRTAYTYDGRGKTLTVTAGEGAATPEVTQYTYDKLGRRIQKQIDPAGLNLTTVYTYDKNDNVVAKTEAAGKPEARTTRYVYDANDRLIYTVDALGGTTKNEYDAEGRVTKTIAYATPLANLATLASAPTATDITTRLSTSANDETLLHVYDKDGREVYTIDALGGVTQRIYDANGNVIQRTVYATPISVPAAPTPAGIAPLVSSTNPNNQTTRTVYDAAGRVFESVDGMGIVTRYAYDALGNVTDKTEAFGLAESRTTHTVYDKAGRLIEQTTAYGLPEAATSRFGYDAAGNQTTYIDPRGVELTECDTAWALAERLRLGYTVLDTTGTRAKRASELNATEQASLRSLYTTTQTFDPLNRKLSATDPLGNTTQTVYDTFGNIVKAIDPNGNAGYFYYDALNRLSFQIDPEGDASETRYNAQGKAVATIKYANKVQGAYNEASRPQLLTAAPATPPSGPYLVLDSLKDQQTLAEYDALGRNTRITDAEGHGEAFQYDTQGNVKVHTDKNGNVRSYDYDALNRKIAEHLPITSKDSLGNPVPVVDRYEYDALGNKTKGILAQSLPEERVTQYVYDKNNRLIETVEPPVLVTQSAAPSQAGSLQVGVGGTASMTTYLRFWFDIKTGSHWSLWMDVSWPPIQGYGDGNIKVVWTNPYGTFSATVAPTTTSVRVYGPQAVDGTNAQITPSDTLAIYKETPNGDVRVAYQTNPYGTFAQVDNGLIAGTATTGVPSIFHFTGEPAGKTLRLAYWPASDPNNITEIDLKSYTPGTFSGMAQGVLSGDYGYEAKVFDVNGEVLNFVTGTFSVVNGVVTTTTQAQPLVSGVLQVPHVYKAYDAAGNVVRETDAKGNPTYHYYDANNHLIGTVNAERYLRRYFYDAVGNVIAERTYGDKIPDSVVLTTLPDPAAIVGMDAANFRETDYRYNANNLLTEADTQAVLTYDRVNGLRNQALVTQRQYDRNGNVIVNIDGNGNKTYSYYDKAGRKIAEVDALNYLTTWAYDAAGNVLRQTRYATALAGVVSVGSDPSALIAQAAAANNLNDRICLYAYDRMNRQIQETTLGVKMGTVSAANGSLTEQPTDVTIQKRYDASGDLVAQIQDTAETDYIYDGLNRRVQELSPGFTDFNGFAVRSSKTTVYDGVGNVRQVDQNGSKTLYEYDAHGNLTQETDPLGGPTRYYYDLNGNITARHSRRTNPDGTAPAIDNLYAYDKLNRQTSTTDAKNFTYFSRYDAYGEIVAKGLNGRDQEYYEYDKAGRLIKTNKDDGVDRAYLYDADGNETAKIQSAIQDTDLKSLAIDQIAALSPSVVERTESAYDARNQLTRVYQAPIAFTSDNVSIQEVWVDELNNPFIGGTLTPAKGGTATMTTYVYFFTTGFFNWHFALWMDVSWPLIQGYGDGNVKVVWTNAYGTFSATVAPAATSVRVYGPQAVDGFNVQISPSDTLAIYKETPNGDVRVAYQANPYGTFQTNNNVSAGTATTVVPSILHFTGQRTEAQTMQLWLWPAGSAKPVDLAPIPVPKLTTKDGIPIDGHFVFDWTNKAAGNYSYEFKTFDVNGNGLDYVRGTLTLGDIPTVNSKEVHQVQLLPTPGSTATVNVVARAQSYDAFGEVVQEMDGRGNVTDFAYDTRGDLLQKLDPETNATLGNGAVVRVRPATRYYYDYLGRAVGMDDANGNRNTQRYDAADHLLAEYHPDGGIKQHGYDAAGNQRTVDNEIGERTRYTYDAKNQLIRVDHPTDANFGNAARYDLYDYDEAGRRIRHTNALGSAELTYYDDIGRVKQTTTFAGIATKYRYIFDAATGGTTFVTLEGDGRTLKDTKDYFGRLLQHVDLGGHQFTYTYNKAGWLTQQVGDTNLAVAGNEQNIGFTYYQNGYLKEVIDSGISARSQYEYDQNGNRTFEGYTQTTSTGLVYYQASRAQYDELDRVVSIHDPKYDVSYEYDANGNRRHVFARYQDGLNNDVQTQDYWYDYDTMNRFVVTKGTLQGARGSGTIVAGTTGVQILYNRASERKVANNESYNYAVDGLLSEAYIDNILRARRAYDAVGDVTNYQELDTSGGIARNISYTYNADSTVRTENDGSSVSNYGYDAAGNLLGITNPQSGGTTVTTTYSYEYWDTAKQSQIKVQASNAQAPDWKPGFSNFIYDVNGHLTQLSDMVADRHLSYKLDAQGLILQRNELIGSKSSKTQYYYYLNGIGIGDAGGFGPSRTDYASVLASRPVTPPPPDGDANWIAKIEGKIFGIETQTHTVQPIGSADFDYNYMPINDRYPATTPGTYTVRSGDTLQSVALAVWGDANLWYIIADANGLSDNPTLIAGQNLVIPNVVANIHNNASTFRVYNPGELIGDTTPTLPDPPPPPRDNDWFAIIFIVAIAIVVSIATEGALSGEMEGWAASAIGAAAGSAASQVMAKQLGLRDHFSLRDVGTAALTAGLTYDVNTGNVVTTALLKDLIAQGVRIARSPEEKFSWSELAAAPINSYIDQQTLGVSNTVSAVGATSDGFTTDLLSGLAKGAVSQGMAILINRRGKIDWSNIAANALGSAIGKAFAAGIPRVTGPSSTAEGSFGDMQLQGIFEESAQRGADRMAQAVRTGPFYADASGIGGTMRDVSGSTDSLYLRGDVGDDAVVYNNLMKENARIVGEAAARGESLAPTSENVDRLGLYDGNYLLALSNTASGGADGPAFQADMAQRRAQDPFAGPAQATQPNVYIQFGSRANSSALTDYSRSVISDVANQADVSSMQISSTSRSPEDQARVMYENLMAGTASVYKAPGQAVIATFENARDAGLSAEQTKALMASQIRDFIDQGIFVSNHLGDPSVRNVFDVAPSSVSNPATFEAAARANPSVTKFLSPTNNDPAFHFEIVQPFLNFLIK